MKTHSLVSQVSLIGGSFFYLLLGSCTKEAAIKPSLLTVTNSSALNNSDAISKAISPAGFLGVYSVRDAKTIFMGQANASGSNVFIHLDYLDVRKSITPTADKKHLTMPYGPSTYVDSGWAYIIDYDAAGKTITIAPNTAMIADIVPGSFEALFVSYDTKSKEGTFATRFTALADKGNETEISENFWKQ